MDAGSGAPCWVYDMPSYTYQRIIMALVEAKNILIYFIYPTIWVVEASQEAREMNNLRLICSYCFW